MVTVMSSWSAPDVFGMNFAGLVSPALFRQYTCAPFMLKSSPMLPDSFHDVLSAPPSSWPSRYVSGSSLELSGDSSTLVQSTSSLYWSSEEPMTRLPGPRVRILSAMMVVPFVRFH